MWKPRSGTGSPPARAWGSGSAARVASRTTSPSSPSPARAPKSPSCVGNSPIMLAVRVQDQSQVAEARRRATDMAERHGFGSADAGKVALIATELATNLIKHSPGGEILVGTYDDAEGSGIQLLALDQGPGMANVAACLADGYSSAGTDGHGLGAVVRQSHFVDIASWPGVGTAVLARVAPGQPSGVRAPAGPAWGAVSVPMPGEDVCGDSWSVSNGAAGTTLLVA